MQAPACALGNGFERRLNAVCCTLDDMFRFLPEVGVHAQNH